MVDNPKGGESFKRYERYKSATTTLRQIVELSSSRARSASKRREQQAKVRLDIVNDYLRGYILFPSAVNRSPTHFVNAAELARKHKTHNINSLYSRKELRKARSEYTKEKQAKTAALIAAFEAKGFVTFNEQLQFMWEKDPPPSLFSGDGGALHERECASTIGAQLE